MVSGQPEKAEHLLKAIALTNKRPLPPGRLLDVNAQVRSSTTLSEEKDHSLGTSLGRMRFDQTTVPCQLQAFLVFTRLYVDHGGDELLRYHSDQHVIDDSRESRSPEQRNQCNEPV